jgi:predicted O-methyltransferase YrrM
MDLTSVTSWVEGLPRPHLTPSRGADLYHHVTKARPRRILELGTGRGGSTAYIAAALQEVGEGQIISVDSSRWRWSGPSAEEFLIEVGLSQYVDCLRPFATYNWYLKNVVSSRDPSGRDDFDLVFVDGSKDFSTVGLSFVLVSRLIRIGGWLICDDLGWTYDGYCSTGTHFDVDVSELTDEERTVSHVREAFDLFIAGADCFRVEHGASSWMGWAERIRDGSV